MMLLLIRRSLRQHAFSSAICAGAIALAGGLLMSIWTLKEGVRSAFDRAGGSFDAVLGARGSKLQLVLNGIFFMDESPGTVTWADYEQLRTHPAIATALPIATGDNYRGTRIIGTLTNYFTDVAYTPGRHHRIAGAGRIFDAGLREAVLGSVAAERLGLRRGDRFRPYHGLNFDPDHEHDEDYVVVGLLEPSNTPADRVIWIPLAGVQRMGGHDPARATDLSAVLVKFKANSAVLGQQLDREYNREGARLTLAWPVAQIVARLLDRLGWMERVLVFVAWLVAVVASATILTTLYGSLSERRRDLAILRSLGAHRRTVFGVLAGEALVLATLGLVLSLLVHAAIHQVAATVVRHQTGMVLETFAAGPALAWIGLGIVALGGLAGLIPAWKAYRTDVASNLNPIA